MLPQRLSTDTLLVSPRALTNNATVTANLDTKGGNYATIRVCMGSEVNTNAVGPTIVLSESDDTVVTNFATLDTEATVDLTAARNVLFGVDLRGRKRYLRVAVSTATATNDHITVASIGTLSDLENAPNGTTSVADQVVFI